MDVEVEQRATGKWGGRKKEGNQEPETGNPTWNRLTGLKLGVKLVVK
jgi:hypothetical protein